MKTETIIEQFIQAILARNAESVSALLAEDVTFSDPMHTNQGRQKLFEIFNNFFAAAETIHWDIKNKMIQGNVAAIERVNHITLKNGKKLTLPIVAIIEIRQDKIQHVRDYFDVKTFTDQIA